MNTSNPESVPNFDWEFEAQQRGPAVPIFFALRPSAASREEVIALQTELQKRNFYTGKYKAPHKIHTTILFVGSPWDLLGAIQERNQHVTAARFYELFTPFAEFCSTYSPNGLELGVLGLEPFGRGNVLALAHKPNHEAVQAQHHSRLLITNMLQTCGINPERFINEYEPFEFFYDTKLHTSIFTAEENIRRGAFSTLHLPDCLTYDQASLKGIKPTLRA